MPKTTPPHWWTATETLEELHSGRIGAVELLTHMKTRAETLGPQINAVIEAQFETAFETARAVDGGKIKGSLAGLPMTIKDTFEVEGFGCRAGIPELADYRSARDADAVARLRSAGAVFWGKTNVPLAAADHQSYNPIFGVTNNPWDHERTPGGSSGGSAAALAAGFTSLELGSDIGGSIRIPSHFCGTWGHKPSYGIVSQRGQVPPNPGALVQSPIAVCGPMARSSADLILGLDILAGAPPGEAWMLKLPESRAGTLKDFRVAVWSGGYPVDPEYRAAISLFGHALAKEGASVVELDATPHPLVGDENLYISLLFAVIGGELAGADLSDYDHAAAIYAADTVAGQAARAIRGSTSDFFILLERQAQHIAKWSAWFQNFDILIAPVSMTPAFRHQNQDGDGPVPSMARTLDVGGEKVPYLENLLWPGVATLAHLPSTARPIPWKVGGLPAGVQLIGPSYGDRTTLAFSTLCDEIFGTFVPPSGYA
ncbi:amidase [Rhizobium sp. AQ_MP]|uniref:amidase family protein n=1 Tax=Rhizobium sp. AQ_MP TaxID=2761536 RepID=UPI00163AE256|nr:amidase family protein [Rhizobium sp. AQ_MP]MBC2775272.1 amidase [Rhizobium sp. AQ_MP]